MEEVEVLKKRIARERSARKQAESILEQKALELYHVNQELKAANNKLEQKIITDTRIFSTKEENYKKLVEEANDLIYNFNLAGEFTYINSVAEKVLGFTKEEMIGKNVKSFLDDEHYNQIFDQLKSSVKNAVTSTYLEFPLKERNGKVFWLGQNTSLVTDEDGNYYFSVIARDITVQKEAEFKILRIQKNLIESREIAEKAQRSQKEFLASISHEIQTPLNAIIGMSHLLSDTKLTSEQFDLMEQITGSSYILKYLIADLLGIAKIDSGIMEAKKKPFDLHKIFDTLDKVLKIKLVGKNVDLKFNIDKNIKFLLEGDGLLINQVLMNLLSNAIKFTPEGTVSSDATIIRKTETEATVRLSVTDTGIGISEDVQEAIFEPYQQAHKGIKAEYGGTGLGLSISKKLVDLMGGEINIFSELEHGSTFYFDLPFGILEKHTTDSRSNKSVIHKAEYIDHPILIVEDNALNQNYISKLLQKWNIDFLIADNGKIAVEMAEKQTFCLILMDLQMPVMDGFKATSIIRNSTNPRTSEVPIIAVTASTLLNKRQDVIDAGMDEYLSKPFTPDQLAEVINHCLDIQRGIPQAKIDIKKEEASTYLTELDADYLKLIYEEDVSYAFEMFEIFLESIPAEFDILVAKVTEGLNGEVYSLAHKIKPTFAMVGLTKENILLSRLEEDAQKGKPLLQFLPELKKIKTEKMPIVQLQFEKLKQLL